MAVDVSYVSALGAGAISFLSPCVLPLVPPYLCYMAGVSVDQFRGQPGESGGAAVAAAPGGLAAAGGRGFFCGVDLPERQRGAWCAARSTGVARARERSRADTCAALATPAAHVRSGGPRR